MKNKSLHVESKKTMCAFIHPYFSVEKVKILAPTPFISFIWMTFQNETQYPNEGLQTFQVIFQQGKVVDIQPLAKETKC